MVDADNVPYLYAAGDDLGAPTGGVDHRAPQLVQIHGAVEVTLASGAEVALASGAEVTLTTGAEVGLIGGTEVRLAPGYAEVSLAGGTEVGLALGATVGLAPGAVVALAGEPTVFKPLLAVDISSEVAIWTPESGKKFRLLGFVITQGTLTGDVTLRDDTGGSTLLVIPAAPVGQPLTVSLGRVGLLSGAADRVLTAQGASTETLSGFVYGVEEV
jgi:hypothetical protein